MTRQGIPKQLAFHGAPGAGTPVAEVLVFAHAGFGLRAALQRQGRRFAGKKASLPQEYRRLAT
jgi:hypothetical protein